MMVSDPADADARDRLLAELPMSGITAPHGWTVETEQPLSPRDLYVLKLAHTSRPGWVTVEASGHRRAGGYEYLVSVCDAAGQVLRGPSSFSYPLHALYWAQSWLGVIR